jgi:hypothetical protein
MKGMSKMKMDRRELLRKVGLGSLALASLPKMLDVLAAPVWAEGQTNFHFIGVGLAGAPGTPAAPQHSLIMGGQGRFNPDRIGSQVEGGGVFVHFTSPGANPPPGGTPLPIVASGSWVPRLLVNYKQIGTYGVGAAGVLDMVIDLLREVPSKALIRGATLRVVCNIGPAGLVTGEREGFTLSIPGTEFSAGGTPGPFVPFGPVPPPPAPAIAPGIGVTIFSIVSLP